MSNAGSMEKSPIPQKMVSTTDETTMERWLRITKLPNSSNRLPIYPSKLFDISAAGSRSLPNDNRMGVSSRQVSSTASRQSEVLMPMARIGTIFIDRNVIMAATVVSPDSNTPQPVSPTASLMDSLRLPVSTNCVLKKLYR